MWRRRSRGLAGSWAPAGGGSAAREGWRIDRNRYDVVVLGGGAGGLTAARAARRRGRRVALAERARPGGECTFTGCVPSKTLLETARRVAAATRCAAYGFDAKVEVDFARVMERVRRVVEEVASQESPERLRAEGIELLAGDARFLDDHTVEVDGRRVVADRLVIATGSRPSIPSVEGLDAIGPLTNESVFRLRELPRRLLVLGGGAVGVELAQAFARLGAEVVLLEMLPRILHPEEPEASATVVEALAADGVAVRTGVAVRRAAPGPVLELADGERIGGSHLLVAAGRTPDTAGLGLELAGVATAADGAVVVDGRLRTSRPHIYAVGDCATSLRFTHVAHEQGLLAVGNTLGRRARRFDPAAVPWVVFTDPEVGRVGMTEAQAFQAYGERARVAWLPLAEVDRARCAGQTGGFVKLLAAPRRLLGGTGGGRLVGMTAVGPAGGELVAEGALALRTRAFAGRLAQTVHAYPTWSMAIRQAAAQWFPSATDTTARPARPP
jgi:pyruvate/2-oxoglutarate dehydrogenase complex dihydrolipoamide dehydrogenase (E3) component